MISAIETVDRMNTCDDRLRRRTEDDIERAIIAAADQKRRFVRYHFDFDIQEIRDSICRTLTGKGYKVFQSTDGISIVWSDPSFPDYSP